MKILIYALGGGLGHITRAYKLTQLFNTQYPHAQILVLASYQKLPKFLIQNLNIQWIFPQNLTNISLILKDIINKFNPNIWVTDVFVNGLFFELPFILNYFSFYKIIITRILNLEACRIFSEVHYNESWQIEWLPDYMNEYLKNLAPKNLKVKLPILQNPNYIIKNKKWIIHTGNPMEIDFIKKQHPHFEVIDPMDYYPLPIFEDCELATAAGCNILQDLSYIQKNHYIYPQKRKYDNQWIRAENYQSIKSGFMKL